MCDTLLGKRNNIFQLGAKLTTAARNIMNMKHLKLENYVNKSSQYYTLRYH